MVKTYKVGGYVRDVVMGVQPKDCDYVVVGANHEYMIQNGYKRVGKDFPVYLHSSGDEYALARSEMSNGPAYGDFDFVTDNVTLEMDTKRRDFTINSIAMDDNGDFIDYHGGIKDIENKVFRPVSDAFMDDPVRVLRLARLRARYGSEWSVSDELYTMIRKMNKAGMFAALDKERIWKEMSRALMEEHAWLFFETLLEVDVLNDIFPEIYKMLASLEFIKHHPEGNTYRHTQLVVNAAIRHGFDLKVRIACLLHDIGKTLTPISKMPKHYGHDVNGVKLVQDFCDKYGVPSEIKIASMFATRHHMKMHNLENIRTKTFVEIFDKEVRNNKGLVDVLVKVGICDHQGRLGRENAVYDNEKYLHELYDAYQSVKFNDVFPNGETDVNKIKAKLYEARIKSVRNKKKELLEKRQG